MNAVDEFLLRESRGEMARDGVDVPTAAYIQYILDAINVARFWVGKSDREWDGLCGALQSINEIRPPSEFNGIGKSLRKHYDFIADEIKNW